MADHDQGNGADPFPPLPRNPVPYRQPLSEIVDPPPEQTFEGPIGRQLAGAVAALLVRSDQRDKDTEAFSASVFEGFGRNDTILRQLHAAQQEMKVLLSLPPMRAEADSSAAFAAIAPHARRSLSTYLKEKAQSTPGGPGIVQAPTEELEQAAQGYFEEQMAVYEAGKRLRDLEAEKAQKKIDEAARAERRRTFWALTVSASIAAIIGAGAIYFVTKATEHEKGFSEGLKAAPTTTVVVAAAAPPPVDTATPQASASAARAFAPSAPAAAPPRAPAH